MVFVSEGQRTTGLAPFAVVSFSFKIYGITDGIKVRGTGYLR
jgi:hypothetical protein